MVVKKVMIHTDHTQAELTTYFLDNSPEMGMDRKRPVRRSPGRIRRISDMRQKMTEHSSILEMLWRKLLCMAEHIVGDELYEF